MQRPRLPRLHCFDRGIGLRGDRQARCFGAMHFIRLALDFAHRCAARVARQNLVGESGPAGWVFGGSIAVRRRLGDRAGFRSAIRPFAASGFCFLPLRALPTGLSAGAFLSWHWDLVSCLSSSSRFRSSSQPAPVASTKIKDVAIIELEFCWQRIPMRAGGSRGNVGAERRTAS